MPQHTQRQQQAALWEERQTLPTAEDRENTTDRDADEHEIHLAWVQWE